jgi:anti-sigma regulatory factor (Ser/Thr protein kinase)
MAHRHSREFWARSALESLMKQTFPAEAPAAGQARRAAAEFAAGEGADADTLAAIALCVSEAVTNAVVHAYRDQPHPGAVEIEACRPNGYLCLYVRDQGCGLMPRLDSPGLGLGLLLITRTAAAVEVRGAPAGGTELVMRFDLAA